MALQRVWLPSPFWSSPRGQPVRLVVLHTAEGSTTYQSLGAWFQNPSANVSSHVGIDDTPGVVGEYVHRDDGVAWTAAAANAYSTQAELCAFAAWTPADWQAHPQMLANTAAWVAEECAHFGIPIVRLTPAQAQDGRSRGVCQHVDLGPDGGGHWDCGGDFPMDQVLAMANGQTDEPQEDDMPKQWLAVDDDTGGVWELAEDGGVFAYDGAPFLGAPTQKGQNVNGWPPAGIASYRDQHGAGYVVTLDAGTTPGGDRFRRLRYPRDGSAVVK